MNIIVLSRNVRTCAEQYCDSDVVRKPAEYARLLSAALRQAAPQTWAGLRAEGSICRAAALTEPSAQWTMRCFNNYLWLARLALLLCEEYEYRFNSRRHSFADCLALLRELAPASLPRARCITALPIDVPAHCSGREIVAAYRCLYCREYGKRASWTGRPVPAWFEAGEREGQR